MINSLLICLVCFGAVAVYGCKFVSRHMTVAAKWKWNAVGLVLNASGFALFVFVAIATSSGYRDALLLIRIVVPALAVMILIGIRCTKYCDQCGATLYQRDLFVPMRYCTKCGASLDVEKTKYVDSELD